MDQNKTILPCLWSQLSTAFFKGGDRLVSGVIGAQFKGPVNTEFIVRTVWENCQHGSDMQASATLMNLHLSCLRERHVPQELYIGADNTPKETKNQYYINFLAWLLCAARETPLWSIHVVFLLVGHTHGSLDRFFSHVSRVLMGKSYFTLEDMWGIVTSQLKFDIKPAHLYCSYDWKSLGSECDLPAIGGLRHCHVLNVYRSGGINLRWKQFMTDDAWSKSVVLVPAHNVHRVADWRPRPHNMIFEDASKRHAWIDKFEAFLTDAHGTSQQFGSSLKWLRDVVNGCVSECHGPGIDEMLDDICRIPSGAKAETLPALPKLPQDALVQFFPGSDVTHVPVDSLVNVTGPWQPEQPPNVLMAGSPSDLPPWKCLQFEGTGGRKYILYILYILDYTYIMYV